MTHTAEDLELALRHVREGEDRIFRQHALILRLAEDDHSTILAQDLLDNFELILAEMRTHLALIESDLARPASIR